jgi:hypothetical protein
MQLADKRDDMSDQKPSNDRAGAEPTDDSKTPPPASLTASLIHRGQTNWHDDEVEPVEQPAIPEAGSEAGPEAGSEAGPEAGPEAAEEPADARAQQAILEEAFVEPAAAPSAPPIERSEFQSARDSATRWRLRSGPSSVFWERMIKDVSIFTIFFAVLMFAILQTI